MSRYSIILKKSPAEIEKERSEKIVQFGLEQDVDFQRVQRSFFLTEGQKARLGIVFDDPKTLFFGSKVHYHGTRMGGFFCKSTPHHNAVCCAMDYPGRKPVLRMATIVTEYPSDPLQQLMSSKDSVKVIPWVFGKTVFNKIKELNQYWPVDRYDFGVTLERSTSRFKMYNLIPTSEFSQWQQSPMKDRILEISRHIKNNIRQYIARDLDESDIRDHINSEMTQSEESLFSRPVRQRRRVAEEEDDAPTQRNLVELNLADLLGDA